MKYYDELSALESELIRLSTFRSLLSVTIYGVESSNREDVVNSLYCIQEILESVEENLVSNFQILWETVRNDSIDSNKESAFKTPGYDFDSLNKVTHSWIEP